MSADYAVMERYRERRGLAYRCPACLQKWFHPQSLIRHMRVLHHRCRFCTKAYIRVERHEKLSHTDEWAVANGACAAAIHQQDTDRAAR